jgi:hypothetical protein
MTIKRKDLDGRIVDFSDVASGRPFSTPSIPAKSRARSS